ncbi:MAG TPA: amidophosphoribosyltransferase [Bacteroidales bacterium]|nr:amidophosphoribosyltransferase [Bacteroidales bacterium]
MTDQLQHDCGIALVRLLKPLEYYQLKYGTWQYGLQKLYLIMEKERNRGQDGTGVMCVKLDMEPGNEFIYRERSVEENSIGVVFQKITKVLKDHEKKHKELIENAHWAKQEIDYAGELYLGHLRYGTFGNNTVDKVHPVLRRNNWRTRNLALAGNFNLTNVDELFNILVQLGQFPRGYSDTITVLENVGHFLDRENQILFDQFKQEGHDNVRISELIGENMNIANILREASKRWDGGYAIAGIIGHGDSFVVRDPWGIRPAYYYHDDEVAVVASERPVIQTAFDLKTSQVKEVRPGSVVTIRKNGQVTEEVVREPLERKSCSFERIYFSRGSDHDINKERRKLGELLSHQILKAVNYDLENTVFSYIPNTAETAFYGMLEGIENYLTDKKKKAILEAGANLTPELLNKIMSEKLRVEKVAIKDVKLRTFITQDKSRTNLVGHVYDVTYGTIRPKVDSLVIIDDSIVRGTTLKKSIIKILDRLEPKKIVVVSSSPQICYPDCYGIDMAKLGDFVAFQAAIELLKEKGKASIINEVYKRCKEQQKQARPAVENYVKEIYKPFTPEEISKKIAQMLRTPETQADLEIIYQSVDDLHKACPHDLGDWYFTGNYPTQGGNKVANNSFINYVEGNDKRAY